LNRKNRTDNPFDDILFWFQLASLDFSQIFYEDKKIRKKEHSGKLNQKIKKSSFSGKDNTVQKQFDK
jgi:hypothetical protein